MFLCNEHHRRRLSCFCRKKTGSGKIRDDGKHTSPAVAKEPVHESNLPPPIDDDDPGKTQLVFLPQTVYYLVEDELDTAGSKHVQDETKSTATLSKPDQDETKSTAQSSKDMVVHEAYEKDENKMAYDTGKIKKISRTDRDVYRKGPKTKRVSLDQVELDFSNKSSGIVTATTYTKSTHATASTMTSRGDHCVGATVEELGAVMFNAWSTPKKSHKKDGIPAVISIRPPEEKVVMTLGTPIGCFNPVQTAIQVGAAIEMATSGTFSPNKHRQLQNVRGANNRSSRKRELRSRHRRIELGNSSGSGGQDSFDMRSPPSPGHIDRLQTVMEVGTEMERESASQSFSFNTKQRQLQEPNSTLNRRKRESHTSGSGLAKQCAVIRVDHLKVNRATIYQHGRHAHRPPGSIAPFSQCAVLEVTKSMSEESGDDCAFADNPNYLYRIGSVSAASRYR